MLFKEIFLITLCFLLTSVSKCDKEASKKTLSKIEFDYSSIDENGLLNGVTSVDYEFCIPMEEEKVNEIKAIEPDVNIPRMAKGRIKCGQDEYLCIVSTNDPDWKKKLYSIASLPYVKRIIQTDYE